MSEPAGAPPTRGRGGPHRRFLTILAAVFVLVGSAFVGFGARDGWFARDSSSSSTAAPAAESSSDSSSTASSDATDFGAIADRVDDAIVNITTQTSQGVGAGTGMIISSKGLVLTNHHVISGAEELEIEVGGNGRTYDAHVVGYSIADDVALVQIEGVSGLPTIDTDDSVSVNEEVLVIGNALGRGGEPTVSPGVVVAIGRQITATDRAGGNGETLTGMIQVAASVQPGQSGGAVVDDDGEVVGMTTAASVNGGFRFGFEGGSDEAYAIPIARAVAAAETIQLGTSTDEIHVGPRGVMGVEISGRFAGSATGVPVSGVTDGGPADDAGISEGSTIVSIDDSPVRTADDITVAMNRYAPGDDVKVTWLDSAGSRHTAILELIEGPPA
jgi:S1-C subfamily serine protease